MRADKTKGGEDGEREKGDPEKGDLVSLGLLDAPLLKDPLLLGQEGSSPSRSGEWSDTDKTRCRVACFSSAFVGLVGFFIYAAAFTDWINWGSDDGDDYIPYYYYYYNAHHSYSSYSSTESYVDP